MKKSFFCLICVLTILPSILSAQAGSALQFDGQNTYAMVPRNNALNSGNITIEAWIRPNQCIAQDRWDSILNKPYIQHVAPHYQWNLTRDINGAGAVSFTINGQSMAARSEQGIVQLQQWNHLAATYDGEVIRVYIQGQLRGENRVAGRITGYDTELSIGRLGNVAVDRFNGLIDEVRVWNFARSEEQIRRTMNVSLSGREQGLIGYWRFDEGQGQRIADSSPTANHGRLGDNEGQEAADPRWVQSDAPIYGGELALSSQAVHFGPVARGTQPQVILTMANIAEEDDEWHAVNYQLIDEGGAPRWLQIEPDEGIIAVGDTARIVFTALTNDLEPDEYQRNILLQCNASNIHDLDIPVTMILVLGEGSLTGRVTNAANDRPVQDAIVRMVGDFEMSRTTDAEGLFRISPIPAYTYTIQVTALDFLPLTSEPVEIQPRQDVEVQLELLHAEFALSPARIDRSMPPNEVLEVPLTLRNNGNGPLAWGMQRILHGGADIPPWQFRAEVAAGDSARDTRMGAVEFVHGMFYTAGGNSGAQNNYFYVFDREGNLRARYDQPAQSAYGMRDLCYDGALIWGADGNNIYGVDLEGRVQDQFPAILRPTRNIAWDPVHELLWTANVTTAIVGVNRDGQEIRRVARPGDARINGMAWWPEDPEGFNLYLFTANGDLQKQVWKVNVDNGQFRILRDLPEVQGARSGGLCISGTWDPYSWVFMSMLDSPDHIGIWQLAPRTGWLDAGPTEGVVEAGQSTEIAVTFDANGLVPEVEYTADLSFTHNGVGGSFVAPIVLLVTAEGGMSRRDLDFANGWNMVSLNVALPNPDIRTVMRPLVEQNLLLLMKDGTGRFYNPAFDFCNIPDWNSAEGYQVKVDGACELSVEGEVVPWDTPIALRVGWQLISYYPRPAVNAITAFQNIVDDLAIVKDGAGHFYLPDWGFNNIGNCVEGQGYQVKMDAARELVYSLGEGVAGFSPGLEQAVHFTSVKRTGRNMSVLVEIAPPASRGGIKGGVDCEVAAFNSAGWCVGATPPYPPLQAGGASRVGLAVWGDDPTTEAIDGLREGEAFELRLWDGDKELTLQPTVLEGEMLYQTDGFLAVRLEGASLPVEFGLQGVYPNPFNATATVRFSMDKPGRASLKLYDLSGRLALTALDQSLEAGQHRLVIDASSLPSQVYICRMEDDLGRKAGMKVVVIK